MEELKLIVEAIQSLGEDGKEAFVYYLLATWLLPYSVGVLGLVLLFKFLNYVVKSISGNAVYFSSKVTMAYLNKKYIDTSYNEEEEIIEVLKNARNL